MQLGQQEEEDNDAGAQRFHSAEPLATATRCSRGGAVDIGVGETAETSLRLGKDDQAGPRGWRPRAPLFLIIDRRKKEKVEELQEAARS